MEVSVFDPNTSTKPKAIPNKSDYHLVVYPAKQPYIGGISGTMFHYSKKELEENCDALRKYIEMNKDLVATTWVLYNSWFCPNCYRQHSDQQAASECCWCEDCDE